MAVNKLKYNGLDIDSKFNGVDVEKAYFNGVVVLERNVESLNIYTYVNAANADYPLSNAIDGIGTYRATVQPYDNGDGSYSLEINPIASSFTPRARIFFDVVDGETYTLKITASATFSSSSSRIVTGVGVTLSSGIYLNGTIQEYTRILTATTTGEAGFEIYVYTLGDVARIDNISIIKD